MLRLNAKFGKVKMHMPSAASQCVFHFIRW